MANPELLNQHLRCVLLSSKYGIVKVLVPFVTIVQELDYLIKIINEMVIKEHLDYSRIKVGIMLEIPSVIWSLPSFMKKVDFLSIGTNDLLQFTLASDREDSRLEEYRRASLPILLKMAKQITRISNSFGKDVAVCGESASDPATASLLIGSGIRNLSVRVNALDAIRAEIEGKSIDQIEAEVDEYLTSTNDGYYNSGLK